MKSYETTEFKVGNTTFESIFQMNLPYNYGDAVPECHSHCPISAFFYASIPQIINFINRGLCVNLKDDNDAEKIYFFLTEYNKQAARYNKELGEEANPLALEAEKFFLNKLRHVIKVDQDNDKLENSNPFNMQIAPPSRRGNVIKSSSIQNAFKSLNKKNKHNRANGIDTRAPEEHKMYEIFNSPNLVSPDGKIAVNPQLEQYQEFIDPNLDEMSFGDN